jgi:hypothetical protein
MKSVRFIKIDNYKQVLSIKKRQIDPERTKLAMMEALKITEDVLLAHENLEELTEQYAVYPEPLPDEAVFEDNDDRIIELESKIAGIGEKQILDLDSKKVIPDLRGTKYHFKTNDVWVEAEITTVGISLPDGAVLPERLTPEQQTEIAEQKETERIASLSPENKTAEKKALLDALADEADHLARRAAIQGTDFNAVTWYQEHKGSIEEKYAS